MDDSPAGRFGGPHSIAVVTSVIVVMMGPRGLADRFELHTSLAIAPLTARSQTHIRYASLWFEAEAGMASDC